MKITIALFIPIMAGFFLAGCSSKQQENLEVMQPVPVEKRYYDATVWPDRILQSVSENPATQANISWRTSGEIINGYAEYAVFQPTIDDNMEMNTLNAVIGQVRYDNVHDHYFKIKINGLKPNTDYMIRVGNEKYRSEWFNIRTAPTSFHPFRFLYFGDAGKGIREYATRVFRNAATRYPDARFMIHTGDLVPGDGNDDTWGEWFYSGSWMLQQIPSLPVAGEGDHKSGVQQSKENQMLFPQWQAAFNLPQNGPAGLENLCYYFDYPGLRVVALYSNFESLNNKELDTYLNHDGLITKELFHSQVRWLEGVLAANKQPWLAVVLHHPVFTSQKHNHNELLQKHILPLLEKYNVDLVLQGHDHVYARGSNPDSERESKLPVYVISVTGSEMQSADRTHNWITRSREQTQLYQVIHVNQNSLRLESRDSRGRIADRFQINRDANGQKRLR